MGRWAPAETQDAGFTHVLHGSHLAGIREVRRASIRDWDLRNSYFAILHGEPQNPFVVAVREPFILEALSGPDYLCCGFGELSHVEGPAALSHIVLLVDDEATPSQVEETFAGGTRYMAIARIVLML